MGSCKKPKGFYSEDNINSLYREHVKFLVGVKLSLAFIKSNLDAVYDDIRMLTTILYYKDSQQKIADCQAGIQRTRIITRWN